MRKKTISVTISAKKKISVTVTHLFISKTGSSESLSELSSMVQNRVIYEASAK